MNYLLDIFEDTSWLVLYTPFKYKAGITKSVVIADVSSSLLSVIYYLFSKVLLLRRAHLEKTVMGKMMKVRMKIHSMQRWRQQNMEAKRIVNM